MSYGAYLTEDEKKNQEGASAPSQVTSTPTTTGAPMSYSQYVGSGVLSGNYNAGVGYYNKVFNDASEEIKKQQKAGHTYAEGLKKNAIGTSKDQRDETHRQADIAKERGVVDARSDYQRAVGAYGSNAEAMGSSGLSGSGYGEWLQGNAYAAMRDNVQKAQGMATAQKNAADTLHNQNVLAAEGKYTENIFGIDSQAAKDLAAAQAAKEEGIYKLGLGLSTDQANAYNSLMSGAQSGASLESIKNDARWGDLTSEQQQAIETEATKYANEKTKAEADAKLDSDYNTALGLLADGWTVAEIKAHLGEDAVTALRGSGKLAQIENAASVMARIKSETEGKSAKAALTDYVKLAMEGMSVDSIEAIAKANGHYTALSNGGLWNAVTSEATNYADKQKADTNKQTVQNMIDRGDTREEIEASDAYKDLDTETKSEVDKVINKNEEQVQANIDSILESFSDVQSLDEVGSILKGEAVPESERAVIISKWQEKNVSEAKKGIKNGTLTSEKLIQNIKNGLYGDKNVSLATEYVKDLLSDINGSDVDIFDVLSIKNDLSAFKGIVTNEWWNKIQTTIGGKVAKLASDGKYNLETGIKWSYNGDKKEAVEDYENKALNALFPDAGNGNVATINGVRYGKDGSGNWWKIK